MDIGRALLDGLQEHLVDEAHHRCVIDVPFKVAIFIVRILGAEVAQVHVAHVAQGLVDAAPLLVDDLLDALQQLVVGHQDRLDGQPRLKTDLRQGVLVGGVAHRQYQAVALLQQGQGLVLAHHALGQYPLGGQFPVVGAEVIERQAEFVGGHPGHQAGVYQVLFQQVVHHRDMLLDAGIHHRHGIGFLEQAVQHQSLGQAAQV